MSPVPFSRQRYPRSGGLALALLAAVASAGCGDGEAAPPGGFGGAPPTPVETDTVIAGQIARVVTIPGTVEAIRTIGVNAQVAGAVLEVPVEEGDRVREGQIVARLDDREIRAQLRAAEASFEVAEAAFQRSQQLLERQVITQPEYEADRTAYEAARAQVEQLRTRAGFAEIRSPIGGVVTTKTIQSGDVVGNQTRLLEVAEVDTMVVRVSVSELDIVDIQAGDPVQLRLDALPDELLTASVRRVFPSADPTTRLIPVEVALSPEDGRRTRPGYLARVQFQLEPKDDALLIPAGAIVSRGGGEGVYIVGDSSTVVLRSVTPGMTSEGRVEIVEGLAVGDRIVTAGANLLRDGARIRDVSAGAGPPGGNPGARGGPPSGGSGEGGRPSGGARETDS
jgi:membrane fusion protein (multidrug efflux system)